MASETLALPSNSVVIFSRSNAICFSRRVRLSAMLASPSILLNFTFCAVIHVSIPSLLAFRLASITALPGASSQSFKMSTTATTAWGGAPVAEPNGAKAQTAAAPRAMPRDRTAVFGRRMRSSVREPGRRHSPAQSGRCHAESRVRPRVPRPIGAPGHL